MVSEPTHLMDPATSPAERAYSGNFMASSSTARAGSADCSRHTATTRTDQRHGGHPNGM